MCRSESDSGCGIYPEGCKSEEECRGCKWYGNGCKWGRGSRNDVLIGVKMDKNLYTRKVKYSFVENYSVVAYSQEEAKAKLEEYMKSSRNEPVGCSYGDLDAEIIEDKCEYEEKEDNGNA